MFDQKYLNTLIGRLELNGKGSAELFEKVAEFDDGDDIYYQTTKVYEHTEKGFNYKYRYVLRFLNIHFDCFGLNEDADQEPEYCAYVYLVLMPESIRDDIKQEICKYQEVRPEDLQCINIARYGCVSNLLFTEDVLGKTENNNYCKYEEIPQSLELFSRAIECIDPHKELYLNVHWEARELTGLEIVKDVSGHEIIVYGFEIKRRG